MKNNSLVEKIKIAGKYTLCSILSASVIGCAAIAAEPKENVAEESKAAEQKYVPPEQRPIIPMTEMHKLSGDELLKYRFRPPTTQDELDQLPPKYVPTPEEAKSRQDRIDKIRYHFIGVFKPPTFDDYKTLEREFLEKKLTIQYGGIERQLDPQNDGIKEKGYAQYPLVMTKEKDVPEIVFHTAKYVIEDSGQIFNLYELYPSPFRMMPEESSSQLRSFYDYLSQDELNKLGSLDELLSKIDKDLAWRGPRCLSGKFVFGYTIHPTSTTYGVPNNIIRIENGKRRFYYNAAAAPVIPGENEFIIKKKIDGEEFQFGIIVPE